MKKCLATAMVLVLTAVSVGFGASARWNALGGEHRFILDTSNYAIYPGRMYQFADALWIIPNVGAVPDNMMSGLLVKRGDMAWAIHYNMPGPVGFSALRGALAGAGGNLPALANRIRAFPDLFLTKKMGDMVIGGRLVLGLASSEPVKDKVAKATSVDVGLGVTKCMALGDLDVGLRLFKASFSDEAVNIDSKNGIGLNLDARLMMPRGEGTKLVPVLGLRYLSEPVVSGAAEVSHVGVNLGLGFNRTTGPKKALLVSGVVCDVDMETTSPPAGAEVKVTTATLSYLGGYERKLNSWLTARGGARATMTVVTGDDPARNGITGNFFYNFGIRVAYKKVLVDMLLSRALLHRGPYIISGSGANMATNVCLTYLLH